MDEQTTITRREMYAVFDTIYACTRKADWPTAHPGDFSMAVLLPLFTDSEQLRVWVFNWWRERTTESYPASASSSPA